MSVALKPDIQPSPHRRRGVSARGQSAGETSPMLRVVSPGQAAPEPTGSIQSLPTRSDLPLWLRLLVGLEMGSSVVMGGLMASALVLYGWTVYSQQQWTQTYQRLTTLQKTQQQLMAANEALRRHLAFQAEAPSTGLELLNPDNGLFLEPAEVPVTPPQQPDPVSVQPAGNLSAPIGY